MRLQRREKACQISRCVTIGFFDKTLSVGLLIREAKPDRRCHFSAHAGLGQSQNVNQR